MKTADVIVIGGGLAGFMAAAVAANHGQKVTLLTYGSGSLPLMSGAIDVLGNTETPDTAIKNLPAHHPYKKIGLKNIDSATKFFCDLTSQANLPYVGRLSAQIPIVTAVGTLKHSCLVPESMDASNLVGKKKIFVASIKGLKDFYAEMLVDNLKSHFHDSNFEVAKIDLKLLGGRDITCMDAAQLLTDNEQPLANELKALNASEDDAIILPPILGIMGSFSRSVVKTQLRAEIIETTCLPPSPPGIRLQRAFIRYLQKSDVKVFENSKVVRGVVEDKKVTGVVVENAVREKIFRGKKIILATGGFYSGGIQMREFDNPVEPIFDIPVFFPTGAENWSNQQLFSDKPQGFSMTGIFTNENLNPVNEDGKILFENLHVVGANLGGCDKIFERSAGGIAIASAYKAATI
ncbi:MAG: anaerobic glycerol-3-phosphate dehydrogenase subunit B [Selenomonadaceae bacterium]|nr:anaerobic glycerol-3-phosphate dehydrogenase subunit B [Selenomonadaceae bacterium]